MNANVSQIGCVNRQLFVKMAVKTSTKNAICPHYMLLSSVYTLGRNGATLALIFRHVSSNLMNVNPIFIVPLAVFGSLSNLKEYIQ